MLVRNTLFLAVFHYPTNYFFRVTNQSHELQSKRCRHGVFIKVIICVSEKLFSIYKFPKVLLDNSLSLTDLSRTSASLCIQIHSSG